MKNAHQIKHICFRIWSFISCTDFPKQGLILQKCVFTQTFHPNTTCFYICNISQIYLWHFAIRWTSSINDQLITNPLLPGSFNWAISSISDILPLCNYSLPSFEVNLPQCFDQRIWVALNVLSRGWYEVFCCLGLTKPCILAGHF